MPATKPKCSLFEYILHDIHRQELLPSICLTEKIIGTSATALQLKQSYCHFPHSSIPECLIGSMTQLSSKRAMSPENMVRTDLHLLYLQQSWGSLLWSPAQFWWRLKQPFKIKSLSSSSLLHWVDEWTLITAPASTDTAPCTVEGKKITMNPPLCICCDTLDKITLVQILLASAHCQKGSHNAACMNDCNEGNIVLLLQSLCLTTSIVFISTRLPQSDGSHLWLAAQW